MNVYPMKHATDYPPNQSNVMIEGTPEQAAEIMRRRYPWYDPPVYCVWRHLVYVPVSWNHTAEIYRLPEAQE